MLIASNYDPIATENELMTYLDGAQAFFFQSRPQAKEKPYTIVIPPPMSPGCCTWAIAEITSRTMSGRQ